MNLERELLIDRNIISARRCDETKENEKLDKKFWLWRKKLALAVPNTQTALSGVNGKVNKILLKSFVLKHSECRARTREGN